MTAVGVLYLFGVSSIFLEVSHYWIACPVSQQTAPIAGKC